MAGNPKRMSPRAKQGFKRLYQRELKRICLERLLDTRMNMQRAGTALSQDVGWSVARSDLSQLVGTN